MRLALVHLPSPFLTQPRMFPPLGLLSVGTAAQADGHHVSVIDLAGVEDWQTVMGEHAANLAVDAYGVSCKTPQYPYAIEVLELIRRENPKATVILGGAHPTVSGPEYWPHGWDVVVKGDGEDAIRLAIFLTGGEVIDFSTLEMMEMSLDRLPFPNRSLMALDTYRWEFEGQRGTYIMSQRGCPMKCAFCCGRDSWYYRLARTRSPQNVLRELDMLHNKYSYSSFMFYDDEVNINAKRFKELCQALANRAYNLRAFVKAELFDEEQAELMAWAGFREVCTGVESGDEEILRIIGKGSTPTDNFRVAELCRAYGIRFKAFTIVGLPGETYRSAMATRDWLIAARPDSWDVTVYTPYPGSRVWDHYPDFAHLISFDCRPEVFFEQPRFYKGKPGQYECMVSTPELRSDEIVELREEIDSCVQKALSSQPA